MEITRGGLIKLLRFDQQILHHVEQCIQMTDRGVIEVRRTGHLFFCHYSNIGNQRVTECSRLSLEFV